MIALLLCGWTAVLSGATFEARSQHHAMTVDVLSPANFAVRVTDVDSGEVLFDRTLSAGSPPEQMSADLRDLHIVVTVSDARGALVAGLDVEQGGMLIDSIHASWILAPRRAYLRTAGAGPFRVGGDVKAPVVINRVEPKYTEEARRDRISGIVIVEVLIDKTGVVKDAMVLKPLPYGLGEAALDAVKQWTFQPGTLNGQPVDVIFNLTVNFKIDTPPPPPPGR